MIDRLHPGGNSCKTTARASSFAMTLFFLGLKVLSEDASVSHHVRLKRVHTPEPMGRRQERSLEGWWGHVRDFERHDYETVSRRTLSSFTFSGSSSRSVGPGPE